MNPPSSERTGLDLPAPIAAESTPAGDASEVVSQNPETAPLAAEKGVANIQSRAATVPTIPLPLVLPTSINASQTDVTSTTQTVVPDAADDSDLIEKEWVNKAKQIVDHTREDPYQQSEQITVFKADYMKKRYNKTIKLSE